jgi:heat shock protein HslJ
LEKEDKMRWFISTALAAAMSVSAAQADTDNAPTWHLLSVGGVEAVGDAFIGFGADGAYGSTGCNRFSGGVEAVPGALTFSEAMAVTRMACPGTLGEQENAVLAALRGTVAVAYDPVAELMELRPADDAPVLLFARQVAEDVKTCALETRN